MFFIVFVLVHGGFSTWSDWSLCDKTCGGGTRFKSRHCDSPPPQNEGNECVGEKFTQEECNVQFCPCKNNINIKY